MQDKLFWVEESRELGELKDYDRNPRKMTKPAFQKLCESIKQDGYHARIMVDTNGVIIGGHQRKRALLASGYKKKDIVSVITPSRPLTQEEFDRLNIRDNLPYGEFDFDMLANNFDADKLIDWGMPEDWLGLGKEVIEATDEDDEAVGIPSDPVCKPGDLWLLGDHRLICGDSTSSDVVARLFGSVDAFPVLMVTDPPYGVVYDPSWRDRDLCKGNRMTGKVLNDSRSDWTEAYSLFPGSVAYVWCASLHSHTVAQNLIDCGYDLISQIIWAKQHFALSRGDYHWQHEPCWYAVKKGEKHNWQGKRDQATLWEIKNNNSFGNSDKEETTGHGTQKPMETMLRPIMNNSKEGDYVYDPFLGSGTTLLACEKAKRKCLGIELSEQYCDAIIARWEKSTNLRAVLQEAQ